MLTTATRLRLQGICARIARGDRVSLSDRVYLQKFADRDRSVLSWVNRAQRQQRQGVVTGLDRLLADMDLGSSDAGDRHHPEDDLGEWFGNASPWLRRD
ncbi:MAG: hypothetical protein ACPHAS_09015 [Synechococcus sp.]